jgi:phosphoglycolate phosphatase
VHPSPVNVRRLLLWDIDHTLIETRGVGSRLYRQAFEEITGSPVRRQAQITGRTELAILAETLRLHGIQPSPDYEQRYAAALAHQYEIHIGLLRERGRVLAGAREAVAAVAAVPGVISSVLTGNVRAVAAIKLRVFGLDPYLELAIGAYGDDHSDRHRLVTVAQQRATGAYAVRFDRRNTILIGDSINDVAAGVDGGAMVIAVAAGSKDRPADLRKAGALAVLDSLQDLDSLLTILSKGM